ncbi:MAG: YlbF family regulator [Tuberibacillus sp.]
MSTTLDIEKIREKTEELCQFILDQAAFPKLKANINDFLADGEATALYNEIIEKQRALQQKQQQGIILTQEEVDDFNAAREKLYANSVARDFLNASEELDKIQDMIIKYVLKTIELEKVPTEADLNGGGCACGGNGACSCGAH